jgi:hypothetical protein
LSLQHTNILLKKIGGTRKKYGSFCILSLIF